MSGPGSEGLLLGFYGDDFTGATDAMEALARSGLRTVLFLRWPTPEQLGSYEGLRAVGLAGCSRSLSPEAMDLELGAAFEALRAFDLPIMHYKVCSTFDSSPQIGSIGRALEIGAKMFSTRVVPVVVGASVLGRYCVFGNLFARSGQDSEPYRLDCHPTMSRHPITPMTESDLRLHLARQTDLKIGLLDILSVVDAERSGARYRQLVEAGAQIILIDSLYPSHERVIGRILSDQVRPGATLFVVGSSGVEYSLIAEWQSRGMLLARPSFSAVPVETTFVVSGSCSPVTDRQIAWFVREGAAEISLRTAELVDSTTAEVEIERATSEALRLCRSGRTVICHTSRGPGDPRLDETVRRFEAHGREVRQRSGRTLGEALGRVLAEVLRRCKVRRAVVAGGDTSFHVARQLGIEALEMVAPVAPGCPLCRVHASGSPLDGTEICFKGGQVGKEDFFGRVLDPVGTSIDSF
jgi:3-oxoisoapionate kinase